MGNKELLIEEMRLVYRNIDDFGEKIFGSRKDNEKKTRQGKDRHEDDFYFESLSLMSHCPTFYYVYEKRFGGKANSETFPEKDFASVALLSEYYYRKTMAYGKSIALNVLIDGGKDADMNFVMANDSIEKPNEKVNEKIGNDLQKTLLSACPTFEKEETLPWGTEKWVSPSSVVDDEKPSKSVTEIVKRFVVDLINNDYVEDWQNLHIALYYIYSAISVVNESITSLYYHPNHNGKYLFNFFFPCGFRTNSVIGYSFKMLYDIYKCFVSFFNDRNDRNVYFYDYSNPNLLKNWKDFREPRLIMLNWKQSTKNKNKDLIIATLNFFDPIGMSKYDASSKCLLRPYLEMINNAHEGETMKSTITAPITFFYDLGNAGVFVGYGNLVRIIQDKQEKGIKKGVESEILELKIGDIPLIGGNLFYTISKFGVYYLENAIEKNRHIKIESEREKRRKECRKSLFTKERIGFDDYRRGNVEPTDLMNDFGIRGVQFAATLTQKERWEHSNRIYDAFYDMCEIIGMRPEMVGFGNRLSLCFGARNTLRGAAAHFEPLQDILHLTMSYGAGCIAHEYAHAIDFNLAQSFFYDGCNFDKDERRTYFSKFLNTDKENITDDGLKAYNNNGSHLTSEFIFQYNVGCKFTNPDRAALLDKFPFTVIGGFTAFLNSQEGINFMNRIYVETESEKYKPPFDGSYYCSNVECFARCFECYVWKKMEMAGKRNDYLARDNRYSENSEHSMYPINDEADALVRIYDEYKERIQNSFDEYEYKNDLMAK